MISYNKKYQNMAALINEKINAIPQISEEKQLNKQVVPKQVLWFDTPNFNGNIFNMVSNLKHICGEKVFGKGRGRVLEGKKSVIDLLKKSAEMDVFKYVEEGEIISQPLSDNKLIDKLTALGSRAVQYYSNLPYEQIVVRDHWAEAANVRNGSPLNKSIPLQARVLTRSGKRFSATPISVKDYVIDMLNDSKGLLSEGHVIAFMNSGFKCPECRTIGKIGWCDGVSHRSVDSFRDAVCMSCRQNGVITLFEIKTRWEKSLKTCNNGTYAGSFVALNTLMTIGANVYLVIASRDTGDLRVGKITSAKMRANHNWLYALQEGYKWGGPSSFVTCAKGFMHCPVKMPILLETIPNGYVQSLVEVAISRIDVLK